jgi:hypothetical protein
VNRKKTPLTLAPSSALGVSITLDTGSPGSSIPSSMFSQLTSLLGADPVNGRVDCEYMFSDGGLTYTFYGFNGKYADILVPFKQVIKWTYPGECYLTIGSEFDCSRGGLKASCTSLGADFLRAAYIYVNYDNLTVSVAQATYETPHLWPVGIEEFASSDQTPFAIQRVA